MIQIESIHVEELRGIRDLTLQMSRGSFVVSGPNGSGKSGVVDASNGEQWVINKAIHYNEWADLSKNDFKPVVAAFKELLQQFRCEKPKCDSWLSLTPKNDPVDLRCSCGAFRLNLNEKSSSGLAQAS